MSQFNDTFQGEDTAAQSVNDAEQGELVWHVEEVVCQGFAGDGLNLVDELVDFGRAFVLTGVVSQNLEKCTMNSTSIQNHSWFCVQIIDCKNIESNANSWMGFEWIDEVIHSNSIQFNLRY